MICILPSDPIKDFEGFFFLARIQMRVGFERFLDVFVAEAPADLHDVDPFVDEQ